MFVYRISKRPQENNVTDLRGLGRVVGRVKQGGTRRAQARIPCLLPVDPECQRRVAHQRCIEWNGAESGVCVLGAVRVQQESDRGADLRVVDRFSVGGGGVIVRYGAVGVRHVRVHFDDHSGGLGCGLDGAPGAHLHGEHAARPQLVGARGFGHHGSAHHGRSGVHHRRCFLSLVLSDRIFLQICFCHDHCHRFLIIVLDGNASSFTRYSGSNKQIISIS